MNRWPVETFLSQKNTGGGASCPPSMSTRMEKNIQAAIDEVKDIPNVDLFLDLSTGATRPVERAIGVVTCLRPTHRVYSVTRLLPGKLRTTYTTYLPPHSSKIPLEDFRASTFSIIVFAWQGPYQISIHFEVYIHTYMHPYIHTYNPEHLSFPWQKGGSGNFGKCD